MNRLRLPALGLAICSILLSTSKAESLPASAFANGGGLDQIQLSPNGSRYAGTVRTDTQRALISRKLDGSDARVAFVQPKPDMDLEFVRWLGNDRVLLRLVNYEPGPVLGLRLPVSRLVALSLDGSDKQVLYDFKRAGFTNHLSHEAAQACPGSPTALVPAPVDADLTELWRFEPGVPARKNRPSRAEPAAPLGTGFWADAQGRVRLRELKTADGTRRWQWREATSGEAGRWREWRQLAADDTSRLMGFDGDGLHALWVGADGRTVQRGETGAAPFETLATVAEPGDSQSPMGLLRNEADCRAVGVSQGGRQFFWGDRLDALVGGIQAELPGVRVDLQQWQGQRYLVRISAPNRPPEWLLGDRGAGTLKAIAGTYAGVPPALPVVRSSVSNGGWLLRPANAKEKPPVVLCLDCEVHPDDRGSAFRPLAALLASRGLAVLAPHLTPLGQRSLAVASSEWADAMEAQVQTLVASGQVDGQRVGLVASQVMAYVGLQWASRRDTALRALVGIAPMTDPVTLHDDTHAEPVSAQTREYTQRLLGTSDRGALREMSVTAHPERLRAPLLLLHGDNDPHLSIKHAEGLQVALEKVGLPTKLLRFASSGTELSHPPYRQKAFEAVEAWLTEHLLSAR